MRIHAITMCKNESDFIERFIRINEKLIDHFHIFEDSSGDNTEEILIALQKEFPNRISIIHDLKISNQVKMVKEYHQNHIMNSLKKRAIDAKAEIIIPLDVDELLLCSREELELKCDSLKENQFGLLTWRTCIPCLSLYKPSCELRDIFRPLAKDLYVNHKCVMTAEIAANTELVMGNHGLIRESQEQPIAVDFYIPLFHFPVRSAEQIIAKSLIIDHKFSLKKNRTKYEGYHIRDIAKFIRSKNYQLDLFDVISIAREYLGSDPLSEYLIDSELDKLEEPVLAYTSGSYPIVQVLDNFIRETLS